MTGLAGTEVAGSGVLTRLALRRDRIMLPAWVYVITALVAGAAYTFRQVYTPVTRAQLQVTASRIPPSSSCTASRTPARWGPDRLAVWGVGGDPGVPGRHLPGGPAHPGR